MKIRFEDLFFLPVIIDNNSLDGNIILTRHTCIIYKNKSSIRVKGLKDHFLGKYMTVLKKHCIGSLCSQ